MSFLLLLFRPAPPAPPPSPPPDACLEHEGASRLPSLAEQWLTRLGLKPAASGPPSAARWLAVHVARAREEGEGIERPGASADAALCRCRGKPAPGDTAMLCALSAPSDDRSRHECDEVSRAG